MLDAYGKATILDSSFVATTGNASSYDWQYLHQGGRYDAVSGLYSFRHRDYSPTLQRWVQQDPMGYVDGASLYGYVANAPIDSLDPSGLYSYTEILFNTWKNDDALRKVQAQQSEMLKMMANRYPPSDPRHQKLMKDSRKALYESQNDAREGAFIAMKEKYGKSGLCLARCISDSLANLINPVPGISVNPTEYIENQLGPSPGFSPSSPLIEGLTDPTEWAPGVFENMARYAKYKSGSAPWQTQRNLGRPSHLPSLYEMKTPSSDYKKHWQRLNKAANIAAFLAQMNAIRKCYCKCGIYNK